MWATLTIFTGCLVAVVYCAPPTTPTTTTKRLAPPNQSKCKEPCPFPAGICVRRYKCKRSNCWVCAATETITDLPKNSPNPSELAAMIAKKAASAAAAAAAATNAQVLASQNYQQNRNQQMPKQTTDPFDFFGNLFMGTGTSGASGTRTLNNLLGWQMMGLGGMDGILPFN